MGGLTFIPLSYGRGVLRIDERSPCRDPWAVGTIRLVSDHSFFRVAVSAMPIQRTMGLGTDVGPLVGSWSENSLAFLGILCTGSFLRPRRSDLCFSTRWAYERVGPVKSAGFK